MRSKGLRTPPAAWRAPNDFNDAPPNWRPRPPLESTTYTIVPGALEKDASADASTEWDDELTQSQSTSIDAMYSSMESLTHYEMLGLSESADANAIERAHEALSATFRPSRFARKHASTPDATWQAKLDGIRARIDEAYATLSSASRRACYDAERKAPVRAEAPAPFAREQVRSSALQASRDAKNTPGKKR